MDEKAWQDRDKRSEQGQSQAAWHIKWPGQWRAKQGRAGQSRASQERRGQGRDTLAMRYEQWCWRNGGAGAVRDREGKVVSGDVDRRVDMAGRDDGGR